MTKLSFFARWIDRPAKKDLPSPVGHEGMIRAAQVNREALIEAGLWDEIERRRAEVRKKVREAAKEAA